MRLLSYDEQGDIQLQSFHDPHVPEYAIISHTWHADISQEVTYNEVNHIIHTQGNESSRRKAGWKKVRSGLRQARRSGIKYVWIDTCCIDRANSTELVEAINSMFRWYQGSAICYAYLSDVLLLPPVEDARGLLVWERAFRRSRWFTRGWTLLELLAPKSVQFFSLEMGHEVGYLGDRVTLLPLIHEATVIPTEALSNTPLDQFSVPERLSWMNGRSTTREEDLAYSLFGLFDISLPILYGEGYASALRRLHAEIDSQLGLELFEPLSGFGEEDYPEVGFVYKRGTNFYLKRRVSDRRRMNRRYGLDKSKDEAERAPFHHPDALVDDRPLTDSEFRLLMIDSGGNEDTITGAVQRFKRSRCPAYYALSYCWNSQSKIHNIYINHEVRSITPNLFHALQRLRAQMGKFYIWVDAVCINQDDHDEKNIQVAQMSTFYSGAQAVLIWLGEEDATSRIAFEFIPEVVKGEFDWTGAWWKRPGFAALARLMERQWFRRGWVVQEATMSKLSNLMCGDREVEMTLFTRAVDMIRAQLDRMSHVPQDSNITAELGALTNYHDSPATRLLDVIEDAFERGPGKELLYRKMSLETLVQRAVHTETSNHRDIIYAFLNLASDCQSSDQSNGLSVIVPSYSKPLLDVYHDFVLHCCSQGSLDIICRPWAPVLSPCAMHAASGDATYSLLSRPSWIAFRDALPFGDPSHASKHRINGDSFLQISQAHNFCVHDGTKPILPAHGPERPVKGALRVKGLLLGGIVKRSTRMARAIIMKDCLDILGADKCDLKTNFNDLPDAVWRTLCANRDSSGSIAPRVFRTTMTQLLDIASSQEGADATTSMSREIPNIDTEELLSSDISDILRDFLVAIQRTVWNRRTFRTTPYGPYRPFTGIGPPNSKVGDHLCILSGCSVPVMLRMLPESAQDARVSRYQLIGDAYVHGIMDGELIRHSDPATLQSSQMVFDIV